VCCKTQKFSTFSKVSDSAYIISEMKAVMLEAVRISETSVYSNETIRRYIPEGEPEIISDYDLLCCVDMWPCL
jgi:hypothetical protein